jgi:hypothetical protein
MAGKSTTFLHPRKGPTPKPAEVVSHASHGGGDHVSGHAVPGNIARDGAPKHVHPILAHGGMTSRQLALKGMQHANAVAPDANPASPLSKEPAGKPFVGKPVPVSPGMRSRTAPHNPALGAAILAEAFAASSADDCNAHGINPALPSRTTNEG